MKKLFLIILLYLLSSFIFAQQRDNIIFESCEVLVVLAIPQLLTGKNLTQLEMQNILTQARNDKFILDNGIVIDREALARLALLTLGRNEIVITFGSTSIENAILIGYILEMVNNTGNHYVLTGTNRLPIYNPCNVIGTIISTQAVYVYAQ